MALKIVHYGDPILRKKGKPVTTFDAALGKLADDMVETMHEFRGIGLAAQQVGLALQLCVVDLRGFEEDSQYRIDGSTPPLDLIMPLALVNPVVEVVPEPESVAEEGCLSFPGLHGDVTRPEAVHVTYQDVQGHRHELTCDGMLARCVQHEVDHLNGVLYIDRMTKASLAAIDEPLRQLKKATRAGAKRR